ncbi:Ig-like domain-containing protein [Leyella stercorea]|uniref:Ig-like domain-containing protein n=1 Tax=Leyella stercorea TaxID=363265 RepID=UPI00242AFBCD|nr:Ig-like domain-containing protein [Leyella stercorea]
MNINLRILNYLFVLVCLIAGTSVSVRAEERTFTRINSISELESAEGFIVVNEYYKRALSEWEGTTGFNSVGVNLDNGIVTASDKVTTLKVEKNGNYYYLKTADGLYLSNASAGTANACKLKDVPDETSKVEITFFADYVNVFFGKNVSRSLLYYNDSQFFTCYDSRFYVQDVRMISLYRSTGEVIPPNPPEPPTLQPTSVKFSSTSLTILKGKEYTLPTVTVLLDNGAELTDAQLAYSSSDENVASVDASTGEVTLKDFGTTTITAKYAGSDMYKGSEDSYTLIYQDRLGNPTIVFSAHDGAFAAVTTQMPENSDLTWRNYQFISTNGDAYPFRLKMSYRDSHGFLTKREGGSDFLKTPDFDADDGFIVRVTFDQKSTLARPAIAGIDNTIYTENGKGEVDGTSEYEFTERIEGATSFCLRAASIFFIKKIEIFISSIPPLDIDEKDTKTVETLKQNDEKFVQFKLNRRFVNDGKWYTICLPFNISQQQLAKAFGVDYVDLRTFDHMEGTTMFFKTEENIEAGVPYLIKPNTDIDGVVFDDVKIAMKANPTLQVGKDGYYMQGVYEPTDLYIDGTHVFLGSENRFFRPSETNHTMNGMRAYFVIPKDAVNKILSYNADSEATDVIAIDANLQPKDHKVYNISGMYVGDSNCDLMPGTYIVDGKKVLISNQ